MWKFDYSSNMVDGNKIIFKCSVVEDMLKGQKKIFFDIFNLMEWYLDAIVEIIYIQAHAPIQSIFDNNFIKLWWDNFMF